MKTTIFLNEKFIPQEEAKLSVLTPGFLYGWGLFETLRSYNNRIVYFDEHLRRIKNSCVLFKMRFPYSLDKLKEIIQRTIKINGFSDAYVRLTLWKSDRGIDTLIVARKYQPYPFKKYRTGFKACISRFKQNADSFFARMKTTNYLLYQFAYLEAKHKRFDEAIVLNNRGYITEGSHTNIFLVKTQEIFTPGLECGCLDGITRKVVFDLARKYNFKVNEGKFTPSDLYAADEAFLTNSLIGIMPLVYVEKSPVKNRLVGGLTRFFMKKYNYLLREENED